MFEDDFKQRVLLAVNSIAYGKVATYGEIAQAAGSPRAARQVGGILKGLPKDSSLPWHRVVNRYGKLSLSGEDYKRQYQKLTDEGVIFCNGVRIDLGYYSWLKSNPH